MSTVATGWLLGLGGGHYAAIAQAELIYVLPDAPSTHRVPRTPRHACEVLLWERKVLPLVDLGEYLHEEDDLETGPRTLRLASRTVIVAYRERAGVDAELGALSLGELPERIEVSDEQSCALPAHPARWGQLALSCFTHPVHGAVPILDLAWIYSGALAHGASRIDLSGRAACPA